MSFEDLCAQRSLITCSSYCEGMLSKHDVGETIRRIGLNSGLIPIPEFRVTTRTQKRDIDWVWMTPRKQVVAAFEIDGVDCKKVTFDKASESLRAIDCELKYLILYQVRKFDLLKPSSLVFEQKQRLDIEGIDCVLDSVFTTSIKPRMTIFS